VPCVTSIAGPNGGAQLYERWRRALRGRKSGSGLKPPQAAVVKSDGGERCGNVGTWSRQARLKEASESKPSMKCRKRLDDVRTGGWHFLRDQLGGALKSARAASGM